ncbi:MAG: hypothetical protein H6744_17385 [Deltaproteobacteria bacterium]|nr:hypothetical protein [Deltaproteobacteria bacterium]MCB9788458.1 hypothetical protein [Deltaproteobacteria bacterium]
MSDETDELEVREAQLYQREAALIEMEAQLHQQEQGLVEAERAFTTRTAALRGLATYVGEQKANLMGRAESLGPKATRLVVSMLEQEAGESEEPVSVGLREEREVMLQRRQELLEVRLQLVEEREEAYARRYELLDGAEGRMAQLEEQLMTRELHLSQALRRLITSAAELSGPDDGGELEQTVPEGSPAVAIDAARSEAAPQPRGKRQRRGRQHAWTTQVRFNLDAPLYGGEGHHFFVYAEDAEGEELPGLFVATANLLKEDREVELQIGLTPERAWHGKGIVAWRRSPGEGTGKPGMGIELTWLEEGGREAIDAWLSKHPPVVV